MSDESSAMPSSDRAAEVWAGSTETETPLGITLTFGPRQVDTEAATASETAITARCLE